MVLADLLVLQVQQECQVSQGRLGRQVLPGRQALLDRLARKVFRELLPTQEQLVKLGQLDPLEPVLQALLDL